MKLGYEARERLAQLRDALELAKLAHSDASAKEIRRKIRALERGFDPDAPEIDPGPAPPRKRVKWSRPDNGGRFRVRLVCGHLITVNGVACKSSIGKRAPHTAVCAICLTKGKK